MCFDWKWEFRQNVLNVFRLENYTSNNKNILTFVYWFVFWKVLDNLMDHGGHASFVDYDGQVFIPILNITFPFWSAFYCTIAQITYLQNQAQKHNTVWQEKMILSLLFISKCYLKMIVCRADWGRMSTKRSIQRSFEATLLGFVTWWSLVMKTTPNGHVHTCSQCSSPVLAPGPHTNTNLAEKLTRGEAGRAATKIRGLMRNTTAWSGARSKI